MELFQLQYFATTARTGSMLAAAAECQVTQPTLSTQIKALEEELGVRLFERHARGARLTRAGERMLGSVNRVMGELRQLQREIGLEIAPQIQTLRVGVQPAIATEVMPAPLTQFMAEHPDWRFIVRESRVDQLIELLQSEHVDVCLTSFPVHLPPDLEAQELFKVRFAAYCHTNHPLAGKSVLHLHEVLPFPLVVFGSPVQLTDRLQALARQRKVESKMMLTCDQAATAFAMAATGAGIAVLPAIFASRCQALGVRQIMIRDPGLSGLVCAIWRKKSKPPAALERLFALIRAAAPFDR